MASQYAAPWRQFLHKYTPFLFKKCPFDNYHARRDKKCICGVGIHGTIDGFGHWNGGVWNFTTKEQEPYEQS